MLAGHQPATVRFTGAYRGVDALRAERACERHCLGGAERLRLGRPAGRTPRDRARDPPPGGERLDGGVRSEADRGARASDAAERKAPGPPAPPPPAAGPLPAPSGVGPP